MVQTRHSQHSGPTGAQPCHSITNFDADEHTPRNIDPPDYLANESTQPAHGYGTRRSTQLAHPGRAAGLHKRTREELQAEAQKKREQAEKKKRESSQRAAHVAAGSRRLARLEDERLAADADEDTFLDHPITPLTSRHDRSLAGEHPAMSSAVHLFDDDVECLSPTQLDTGGYPGSFPPSPAISGLDRDHGTPPLSPSLSPPGTPYQDAEVSPFVDNFIGAFDLDDDLQHEEDPDKTDVVSDNSPRMSKKGKQRASPQDEARWAVEEAQHCDRVRVNRRDSLDVASDPELEDDLGEILTKLRRAEATRHDTKVGQSSKSARGGFGRSVLSGQTQGRKRRRNDDYEPASEDEGSEDVDDDDDMPGDAHCRLSAPERRQVKRTVVRGQIDMHRTQVSPGTLKKHTYDPHAYDLPPAHKKRKGSSGSAFRSNWQNAASTPASTTRAAPRSSSHASRPAAVCTSSGRSSYPSRTNLAVSSPTYASSSRPKVRFDRRMVEPDGSEPDDSGMNDHDVIFDREYAVSVASRSKHKASCSRLRRLVAIERISDDDDAALAATSSKAKKVRRRSGVPVPADQSRSSTMVVDFAKPVLYTSLVPTVLEFNGAKLDAWNTQESGPNELLNLIQGLLDELCPGEEYELTKRDILYKVVQQEVYDWRSRFCNNAVAVIEDIIAARFGPKPRRSDVQRFVRDALAPGGEAFFARPNIRHPERARGSLQSPFVLRVFGTHFSATDGAIYVYGPPAGALALAVTAVQHAFGMFVTGRFVPGRAFSSANVSRLTDSWFKKSVRRLVKNEEKFAKLARKARKYAMVYSQPRTRSGVDPGVEVPDLFDRSSPPLEDDMDDDSQEGD